MSPAPTISRLPKRNSAPASTYPTSFASSSRANGSLPSGANAIASAFQRQLDVEDYEHDDVYDPDDGDRSAALHAGARHPDTTHRINDSFNQPIIPFESDLPPILPLGEYATDDPSEYTSDDDDGYTHSEYDEDEEEEEEGDYNDHVEDLDSDLDNHHDGSRNTYQEQQRRPSLDSRLSYSSKDNTASTSSTITNTTTTLASASAKSSSTTTAPQSLSTATTTSSPSSSSSSSASYLSSVKPAITPAVSSLPTSSLTSSSSIPRTTTTQPSATSGNLVASKLKAPASRLRPPSQFSRTTPISSPLSQEIKHDEQDSNVTDQDDQDNHMESRGEKQQQFDQDHLQQAQESAESGLHARYLETEPDWMQEEDEQQQDGGSEQVDLVEDDIDDLHYKPASQAGGRTTGGHARLSTIAEVSELPSMTSFSHHLPLGTATTPSTHHAHHHQEPLRYQSSMGRSGGSGEANGGVVALGNRDLQLEELLDEQDILDEQERKDRMANLKETDILGPLYETQDFKISSLTRSGPSWRQEDHDENHHHRRHQVVPDYEHDGEDEGLEDDHEQPEGSYGEYSVEGETDLDEEAAALKREYEELFGKGEAPPLAEIANSDIFLTDEEEQLQEGDEDDDLDDLFDDENATDSSEERYYAMLNFDNGTNRILENNIPRMPKPLAAPRGSLLPVPSSFGIRQKTSPPAPASTSQFPSRPSSTTPPSSSVTVPTTAASVKLNTPMPSLQQPPTTTITPPTPSQSTNVFSPNGISTPRFAGAQSLLRRNQEIVAAKQAAQQRQQEQEQQRQQEIQQQQAKKPTSNILDGLWDEPLEQDVPTEMSPGAMHAARIAAELMKQEREEQERRARVKGAEQPRSSLSPSSSGLRPPTTYTPLRPSPLASAAPIKATTGVTASRSSFDTNISEGGSLTPETSLPRSRLPFNRQHESSPPSLTTTVPTTSRTATAGTSRLARPSSLCEVRPTNGHIGNARTLARPTSMYDTRALTPPSPPSQELPRLSPQQGLTSPRNRSPKESLGSIHRFGSQNALGTQGTATGGVVSTTQPSMVSRQNSLARKLELQRELQEIEAMEAAQDAAEAEAAAMAEGDDDLNDRVVLLHNNMRSSQARSPKPKVLAAGVFVGGDDDEQDLIESREMSPRSSMDVKYTYMHPSVAAPSYRGHSTTSATASLASRPSGATNKLGNLQDSGRRLSPRSSIATATAGIGLGVDMKGGSVQVQQQQQQRRASSTATNAASSASKPLIKLPSSTTTPALAKISTRTMTTSTNSREALGAPLRRATTATMLSTPSAAVSSSSSRGGAEQQERKDRILLAIPTLEESCKRLASIREEISKMRQEIHQLAQSQDQVVSPKRPGASLSSGGPSRKSSDGGSSSGSSNGGDDNARVVKEQLQQQETQIQKLRAREKQHHSNIAPQSQRGNTASLTRSHSQLTKSKTISTAGASSPNNSPAAWDNNCGVMVFFVNAQ